MILIPWLIQLSLASPATTTPSTQLAASPIPPEVTRFTLSNGLQVSIIYVKNQVLFLTYTHLPVGLVHDDKGRTLWLRLIERLGTQTKGISDGFVNPDNLLVETWSRPAEWQEALEQHAEMMNGYSFSSQHVDMFLESALIDMGGYRSVFQPCNSAIALFAQGYCFRRRSISTVKDLKTIDQPTAIRYRDQRWGILPGTHLTVVSPLPADEIRPAVVRAFEVVKQTPPLAVSTPVADSRHLKMSWDRWSSALVLAWPVAGTSPVEEAAMTVIAHLVRNQCQPEASESKVVDEIMVLPSMRFPGGPLFTVSFDVHGRESLNDALKQVEAAIKQFGTQAPSFKNLAVIRARLCDEFLMPNVPLAIEPGDESSGNRVALPRWLKIRRRWAEVEWRYGERRVEIGRQIAALTPEQIRDTARKYLTDEARIVCTIEPGHEGQEELRDGHESSAIDAAERMDRLASGLTLFGIPGVILCVPIGYFFLRRRKAVTKSADKTGKPVQSSEG